MDLNKAFLNLFYKERLNENPYCLYGSGSCADRLIEIICNSKLNPPTAILDLEPKQKENYKVEKIQDIASQIDWSNQLIIIASLTYIDVIKQKIHSFLTISDEKIHSLIEQNESDVIWQDFSDLALDKLKFNKKLKIKDYHIGNIQPRLNMAITNSLEEKTLEINNKLSLNNYIVNNTITQLEFEKTKASVKYLVINKKTQELIINAVKSIYSDVSNFLHSNWHIETTKIKKFQPNTTNVGSETFHLDGFNKNIFKILLYITPPSAEEGSTELIDSNGNNIIVEGPAGTYLVFNSSETIHRGIRGQKPGRTIVELTISRQINRPGDFSLGEIEHPLSHYRETPWTRKMYGLIISNSNSERISINGILNLNSEEISSTWLENKSTNAWTKFNLIIVETLESELKDTSYLSESLSELLNFDGDLIIINFDIYLNKKTIKELCELFGFTIISKNKNILLNTFKELTHLDESLNFSSLALLKRGF